MRKFHMKKKAAVAVAAAALTVTAAGGAYAYWTTTGAGTGQAANATSNGTIALNASFNAGLTPGSQEAVTLTADNGGTSSLYVGTVHLASVSTDNTACVPGDFSMADVVSNVTVPAKTSGVSLPSGILKFADTSLNQDGCKGATVTLHLTSN